MAEVQTVVVDVDVVISLKIKESEARALEAMFSYGPDAFLKGFYKNLGKSYVEPHEAGVRSLHDTIRHTLGPVLGLIDRARTAVQEKTSRRA